METDASHHDNYCICRPSPRRKCHIDTIHHPYIRIFFYCCNCCVVCHSLALKVCIHAFWMQIVDWSYQWNFAKDIFTMVVLTLANVFTWWDARSPVGGPAWSPSGPTSTCWSRGWRTSCGTWTCRDLKQRILLLLVCLLEFFNVYGLSTRKDSSRRCLLSLLWMLCVYQSISMSQLKNSQYFWLREQPNKS